MSEFIEGAWELGSRDLPFAMAGWTIAVSRGVTGSADLRGHSISHYFRQSGPDWHCGEIAVKLRSVVTGKDTNASPPPDNSFYRVRSLLNTGLWRF